MKKIFFKTFGCRTNIYDTTVMMSYLKDFEIVDSEESADLVVVNSCIVTNGADSSVRGYINRVNRLGKRTILAGCGAFSKGEELFDSDKIYGVFGHSEKKNINQLLKKESKFFEIGDLKSLDETIVEDFRDKTKAYIKIQEGCDFNCSYCIIPSVRGRARSQDEGKIIEQISKLATNGYGEFVLSGTNIGSYGRDKESSIAKLLKKISMINGVKRVRLGSLEPSQIDDEFLELLGEDFLEKHLHIALQHTDEKMLKIMRRKNQVKKDLKLFEHLASRGFGLGTDYIVGHPGESEEIWLSGLDMFKKFPLTHLHIFSYSKRDGTHSAMLKEEVRGDIAKQRLKILQNIVAVNNREFRERNRVPLMVLVEDREGEFYRGYDQFFNKVLIESDNNILKEWVHIENYKVKSEANYSKI